MASPNSDLKAVIAALRDGRSFVLPLHASPDGDCIGSSLALAQALRTMGKSAKVVSVNKVADMFEFLPEVLDIEPMDRWDGHADTVVMVDLSDIERSGMKPEQLVGKKLVNIDHHISNKGFGDCRLVDAKASSCAEIVYRLLLEMRIAVTPSMANLLYLGIMTDTGSFRYESTTASSFETAGALVRLGASPARLAKHIYASTTLPALRILGGALCGIEVVADGMVAWLSITEEMMRVHAATLNDVEGIVNYAKMLPGVLVAASFREDLEGKTVKVGLRSDDPIDVSGVASNLGGGGHARAAGFTFYGSIDRAKATLLEALKPLLKGNL